MCRDIRQKNEGGFAFSWDEEGSPGHIVLEVSLSKHMDSSLIDVDVHPTYVSVVVKGKVRPLICSDDLVELYCTYMTSLSVRSDSSCDSSFHLR